LFFFSVGLSSLSRHSQQDSTKCRDNDERPTGEKNTTIDFDDGEKGNINKLILKEETVWPQTVRTERKIQEIATLMRAKRSQVDDLAAGVSQWYSPQNSD
jgi:hypothetical protein